MPRANWFRLLTARSSGLDLCRNSHHVRYVASGSLGRVLCSKLRLLQVIGDWAPCRYYLLASDPGRAIRMSSDRGICMAEDVGPHACRPEIIGISLTSPKA